MSELRQSTYPLLKKPCSPTPGLQWRQTYLQRDPRFFSMPSVWQSLEIIFSAWFLWRERHYICLHTHFICFFKSSYHATQLPIFLSFFSSSKPLFRSYSIKSEMPRASFSTFLYYERAFSTLHWTLNYLWEKGILKRNALYFMIFLCSFLQLAYTEEMHFLIPVFAWAF